jgi:hypothetical protein
LNCTAEHIDRRLEAVQQIERAAIVEAGVGQRGLAFAGVPKRGLGALEFAARRIHRTQGFPRRRIPGPQLYGALKRCNGGVQVALGEKASALAEKFLGILRPDQRGK